MEKLNIWKEIEFNEENIWQLRKNSQYKNIDWQSIK